jgi:mutator protein MutT
LKDQLRLAGCIILDGNGGVLLLHRHTPKRTQWEIPGGKIDEGESVVQAVVREIREEVGVEITIVRQLGAKEFSEDDFTMHYTWFLGEVTKGTPHIGEPDTFDDLRYFDRGALLKARTKLSSNAKNFLDAWLAGELTLD